MNEFYLTRSLSGDSMHAKEAAAAGWLLGAGARAAKTTGKFIGNSFKNVGSAAWNGTKAAPGNFRRSFSIGYGGKSLPGRAPAPAPHVPPTGGAPHVPPTGGAPHVPPTGGAPHVPPTGGAPSPWVVSSAERNVADAGSKFFAPDHLGPIPSGPIRGGNSVIDFRRAEFFKQHAKNQRAQLGQANARIAGLTDSFDRARMQLQVSRKASREALANAQRVGNLKGIGAGVGAGTLGLGIGEWHGQGRGRDKAIEAYQNLGFFDRLGLAFNPAALNKGASERPTNFEDALEGAGLDVNRQQAGVSMLDKLRMAGGLALASNPVAVPTAAAVAAGGLGGYLASDEDEETGERRNGARNALIGAGVLGLTTGVASGLNRDAVSQSGVKTMLDGQIGANAGALKHFENGDNRPSWFFNPIERSKVNAYMAKLEHDNRLNEAMRADPKVIAAMADKLQKL